MHHDAFSAFLPARWSNAAFEPIVRALSAPLRSQAPGHLRAWAKEGKLALEVLLPGVRPESLDLTIEGNTLRIQAQQALESQGSRSIERQLGLPFVADNERAQARFEDGVLRVTLEPHQSARRIALDGQTAPAGDIAVSPVTWQSEAGEGELQARMRARQEDSAYELRIDAPGTRQEQLSLTLEGDDLRLVGEPDWQIPEGFERSLGGNRPARWTAEAHVPADVDRDGIRATTQDGVVIVTLPRSTPPTRSIEIQSN